MIHRFDPDAHLLDLATLSRERMEVLLGRAEHYARGGTAPQALEGVAVCTLFFEPSTRTRLSFQLAAQRLGAHVLGFDVSTSSASKGETDLDTLRTLEAMGVRGFVVRHGREGAVRELAGRAGPRSALINAGDGRNAHPTQGLLDMLTLRQAKGTDLSGLKVLVVGDVRHSRVARSDLQGLRTLGVADIRVCAPPALLPGPEVLEGCQVVPVLDHALEGVDVVMLLRLQRERMEEGTVESLDAYHHAYGLDARRLALAAPGAVVMHPGPVNRGVEVTDEVADGPQSLILRQVANGVAVRMAVLEALLGGPQPPHGLA